MRSGREERGKRSINSWVVAVDEQDCRKRRVWGFCLNCESAVCTENLIRVEGRGSRLICDDARVFKAWFGYRVLAIQNRDGGLRGKCGTSSSGNSAPAPGARSQVRNGSLGETALCDLIQSVNRGSISERSQMELSARSLSRLGFGQP